MPNSHIVKSYDEELSQLQRYLAQMGNLVEKQLAVAIQAIHARDNEMAGIAFESDNQVDLLDFQLNELGLKILALRQPMASDLRLIIGSMRIARDIERIGDYAASIAKRSRKLNRRDKLSITSALVRMANLVVPVVHEVMDAYMNSDTAKATAAYHKDDVIDEAYNKLIKDIVVFMQENPDSIEACTNLLFMAKNLERIGDRATNIAEAIHFIVNGTPEPVSRKPKQLPAEAG